MTNKRQKIETKKQNQNVLVSNLRKKAYLKVLVKV